MTVQEHGFKAEVQQILDLMIHSVYSDRDVFLRELISNSADALDKARFLSLTESDLAPAGHDDPGVRITVNADANMLVLEDDGIGMTEHEAIENLGTIAHSGTKAFIESLKGAESGPDLIGQFGLGFYSAFMVADQVEVDTLSARPDSEPVLWRSKGHGTFEIERGTRTTRGTTITLYLRDDATEFADEQRMKGIVKKHSNFISWPILVGEDQANSGKALWTLNPSEVTDADANEFYKSVAVDWRDPAFRVHTSVDTPLQYHAMLFVPRDRPFDLFYPEAPKGPRLYARRVLIDEHAKDLLPDWLRFVRGVVDSEDIELNVSREMVQKTPVLMKIRDQLTKKLLKELKRFSNREPEAVDPDEEGAPIEAPATYEDVWRAFGVLLKEGYFHDKAKYGDLILPLLRFNAANHEDSEGLMSLAEYVEAMPEDQDTIWYFAAESREAALSSPHMEAFAKRGWDVLLLTDAVDEWLVSALPEFEDKPVKSISRGELDLDEEDSDEDKADLTDFAPWVTEVLGGAVTDVRSSTRLTDSACVLVDSEHGVSANQERILRSVNQQTGQAQRALELNVKHPLIKTLTELHKSGRTEQAEPIVRLLYDEAQLLEGSVRDAAGVGRRLQDILVVAAQAAMAAESEAS